MKSYSSERGNIVQGTPRNNGRQVSRTGSTSSSRIASSTNRNAGVHRSRNVNNQNGAYNRPVSRPVTPVSEVDYPVVPAGNVKMHRCYKCKSTDIVPNKKGYSVGKFLITLLLSTLIGFVLCLVVFLIFFIDPFTETAKISVGIISLLVGLFILSVNLPISIVVGFVGRNKMIHNCMNCGHRWTPGSK